MKYITLIADYTQSCLHDDYIGPLELNELDLPAEIIKQLIQWNDRYKSIIRLSQEERAGHITFINMLDKEGLELSEKLRILLDAKVRYYSEGLLRYID